MWAVCHSGSVEQLRQIYSCSTRRFYKTKIVRVIFHVDKVNLKYPVNFSRYHYFIHA